MRTKKIINNEIRTSGIGLIVGMMLTIAGCDRQMFSLSQEREFNATSQPVTTRVVETKEPAPASQPTLLLERQEAPKLGLHSSEGQENVARPTKKFDISPRATTRPEGSIEAAVLKINRDYLSASDVLTRIRPDLVSTALTYNESIYQRRAEELIMTATRDLISETLLYQEIAARIPEDQDPAVKKAVDKEVLKLACNEAGGSTVRLENLLEEQGSSMDALRLQLRKQMVTQQYLRERMKPKVVVTREEMWEYYQNHRDEFNEPAKVHLFLIELDAGRLLEDGVTWETANEQQKKQAMEKIRSESESVLKRLKAGEDFSMVAKEVSSAGSGKVGGDLGWISQGSYRLKTLEDRAFSLKVNQIGEPLVIENKRFILKVTEIKAGKTVDFSTAQDQVKGKLEQEVYRKLVMAHLKELWLKSQIGPVDSFMEAVYSRLPDYVTIRTKALGDKEKKE
jgi:parvulin-like peptidyl-prolyl isomerase